MEFMVRYTLQEHTTALAAEPTACYDSCPGSLAHTRSCNASQQHFGVHLKDSKGRHLSYQSLDIYIYLLGQQLWVG